ncbi:MAG TPA: DinB family protein [Burkholderiales bacterium]|nr:DinB family protein [Burkholderiales bacterium]
MKSSLPYSWKSYFTVQADYQLWANDRLFAALGALDIELLNSMQGLSHGSIYGTVERMLAESRIWFARLCAGSGAATQSDGTCDWNRLIEITQEQTRSLQLWLEQCDDAFFERQVSYPASPDSTQKLWVRDALTHLMTYLAFQRGQISAIITRLGYRSLEMDYIHYKLEISAYRENLAALIPAAEG